MSSPNQSSPASSPRAAAALPSASPALSGPVAVLSERFARACASVVAEHAPGDGAKLASAAPDAPIDPRIEPAAKPEFGDFQCNAAMALGKRLGLPPRKVAEAIVAKVDIADLAEPLTPASIAGPGFINVRLRGDALASMLRSMDGPTLGVERVAKPETVVVDLCGVNLAKQMHVGHIRSTVIPDAIARGLERLGHKVIRQSHVGDWGLPIAMVTGKLIRDQREGKLDRSKLTLDQLEKLYKRAQAECERDTAGLAAVRKYGLGPKAEAELEEQVGGATEAFLSARQTLLDLQSREPATLETWKFIYDLTMSACVATCARLKADVTDEYTAGESSYADELDGLVKDLLDRSVAQIDDGATVVRVPGLDVPCLIRKRDGGFLYATTDLAAIRRRVQKFGASRVIYAVDIRQSLHFDQVFGAARLAGYATLPSGEQARLEHAAFGTILGSDGRPFKTRSGESVKLMDLLDEAVARAEAAVAERDRDASPEERRRIAEVVGIAAIKYADLSNDRIKDYVFDFGRMLAFEGNTGPYLLYALVRVRSILRKAREAGHEIGSTFVVDHYAEKSLTLQLLKYPQAVRAMGEQLEPHRLCQFLYDLAGAFSGFFEKCPVLQAPTPEQRASRLRLCDLTGRVLADGLGLLAIPTLERM
ncbi:MAG: arginine--tRNA ligase [Planctomycetota bacterium]|nr:arginine--tRNA ligase [Planctomycetota bacterium]